MDVGGLDPRPVMVEAEINVSSLVEHARRFASYELERAPDLRKSLGTRVSSTIDVGVAIETAEGLLAPVVRGLNVRVSPDISRAVDDLAVRSRLQQLRAEDMGGDVMSVSNAGMHDVTLMTSIINPGQAAILSVGWRRELFRPDADGSPRLIREIGLVLSCDHRVLSGVQVLALLNGIKATLEDPEVLFVR